MSYRFKEALQTRSVVDEAALEEARSWINKELRIEYYNREASIDTIRHYAYGIGDDNPLWCDEEYGQKTKYGSVIAPPAFLYSVWPAVSSPGLDGLKGIWVDSENQFFKVVRLGHRFRASCKVIDAELVPPGKYTGAKIRYTCENTYWNQEDEVVAKFIRHNYKVAMAATGERGFHSPPRESYQYTDEELKAIEEQTVNEERRGSMPRYWEETKVGDELPAVVKGPIDQIMQYAYYAGCLPPSYRACELQWKRRHLAITQPDKVPDWAPLSYFREFSSHSASHHDPTLARIVGWEGPIVNGMNRAGWMCHLLTNWMGDDGFLKRYRIRLLGQVIHGDTIWLRGRVTGKRVEDGEHLVDVESWGDNQLGKRTDIGEATIILPSKA